MTQLCMDVTTGKCCCNLCKGGQNLPPLVGIELRKMQVRLWPLWLHPCIDQLFTFLVNFLITLLDYLIFNTPLFLELPTVPCSLGSKARHHGLLSYLFVIQYFGQFSYPLGLSIFNTPLFPWITHCALQSWQQGPAPRLAFVPVSELGSNQYLPPCFARQRDIVPQFLRMMTALNNTSSKELSHSLIFNTLFFLELPTVPCSLGSKARHHGLLLSR